MKMASHKRRLHVNVSAPLAPLYGGNGAVDLVDVLVEEVRRLRVALRVELLLQLPLQPCVLHLN